ncbi:MAG TPA: hypothetical protein VHN77_05980 [Phycisphaerales bacterium]|nr:hypothetical protein [Phycisphaerales bacterium]
MNTGSTPARHTVLALIAFALPALGFLVVRMFVPTATPAVAHAAVESQMLPAPLPALPGVSDADIALMKTFADAEADAPQRLNAGIGAPQPVIPVGKPRASIDLPTGIALSSVMKAPGGAVAVIQGKLYRTGDRVTPEWTVSAIDDKARTAELTHTNGDRRTLAIEK